MATQKLNVKLLRKIQKHITEEPRRFIMHNSVVTNNSVVTKMAFPDGRFENDAGGFEEFAPCGTAACIAGWANILTGVSADSLEAGSRVRAAEKIGVDPGVSWSSHSLFYDAAWPKPFSTRYARANTQQERAKIASERIEHLIQTGK